jgi:hypothetical protein
LFKTEYLYICQENSVYELHVIKFIASHKKRESQKNNDIKIIEWSTNVESKTEARLPIIKKIPITNVPKTPHKRR